MLSIPNLERRLQHHGSSQYRLVSIARSFLSALLFGALLRASSCGIRCRVASVLAAWGLYAIVLQGIFIILDVPE